MRTSPERVSHLARRVVERLTQQRLVEPRGAKTALVSMVEKIIMDELAIEDHLDQEVRQMLRQYQAQIDRGEVDYGKMFQMVKRQLVKDRGIVL